jgi:hypothetical protein
MKSPYNKESLRCRTICSAIAYLASYVRNQFMLASNRENMIYKFVSCTENEGHFVPYYYSSPILKNEMGSNKLNQWSANKSGLPETPGKPYRTNNIHQ